MKQSVGLTTALDESSCLSFAGNSSKPKAKTRNKNGVAGLKPGASTPSTERNTRENTPVRRLQKCAAYPQSASLKSSAGT